MLKIGIMCRGDVFHDWEAQVIRDLMRYNDISVELLIVEEIKSTGYLFWIKRISWNHTIWQVYFRLASKFMICDFKVDMGEQLAHVDRISCEPTLKGKFSQYFTRSDIDHIKKYDLDVILRFGFNIIRGDILASAKYGVWSYHHGDNTRYRGMPSGFWEIYFGDPVTGSVLQQLTDVLDGGRILKRGSFSTIEHSYPKSRNMIHQASSIWVSQICRDILDEPNCSIPTRDNSDDNTEENIRELAPIYGLPNNLQMIRFLFLQLYMFVSKRIANAFSRPNWVLGILKKNKEELFQMSQIDNVTWIPSVKGSFMADPFIIREKDLYYIFFEDYAFSQFRGRISVVISDDLVTFSNPKIVLEKPYHLSYPYIFKHNDRYYCTPEQAESRKIVLYEADDFPDKWKEVSTIADFPGLDPTIIFHDGRWWLFAGSNIGNGAENAELFLWSATDILGSWVSHPQNPIKTNIYSSRPGGRPFLKGGRWIRPAQDCSVNYGGKLVFNEIIRMTETQYEERVVHTLKPDGSGIGLHTLDFENDFCVIDRLTLDKSLLYFFMYLKNKLFCRRNIYNE